MGREVVEHDPARETVRRRLAENDLKPWRKDMWCIPKVDGTYVAYMEDVLDLYAEAPDPKRPVVCFDESPTATLTAMSSSPAPAPAASRICARLSFRAACLPPFSSPVSFRTLVLAQFHSITYIHRCPQVSGHR
jgi:hypothetical protein